jgi:hypothetical protein
MSTVKLGPPGYAPAIWRNDMSSVRRRLLLPDTVVTKFVHDHADFGYAVINMKQHSVLPTTRRS